ncbi:MAG TPA: DciA family protein [Micromonosporaceae bacterium]|nr:DciA family protein [Micromonosporaceae bacterium]
MSGGAQSRGDGPELARAVLDAARAKRPAARREGQARDAGDARGPGAPAARRRLRGYSGPGPDPRDPQRFGVVLARLLKERGWQRPAAEARVFGMWSEIVGAEVAARCRPVKLDGGELTIEAESTAWATQLRLLQRTLLSRITAEVGGEIVTQLNIRGPVAPSWHKGPKRVRGRGPRDTYG